MSAKKLMLAALITSMLHACGGNQTQAPLPADGTITPPATTDEYPSGGDDGYGSDPVGGIEDPAATDGGTTAPAGGFTLKGIVVDKQTKAPIKGATVTIGSSTQLTGDDGTFEIKDIMDTQVWVNVSKDGFQAIKQENITFSEDKPTADKEFSLAASTGSNDSDNDDDDDSDEETAKFKHLATLGEGKFKTVSAMAVDGDTVYVLGLVDKFLLDSVAVVAFDLSTGNEVRSFRNVGFLKNLPKDASYLKVDDGEVFVSNGEDAWVFNGNGTFLRKDTGARYNPIKEVEDEDKDWTFTVDGSKIEVDKKGPDVTLGLEETSSIKAIGLGPDHTLVVLDGSNSVVHSYEFDE